jgi:putative ABC transport system substrate-binding protein
VRVAALVNPDNAAADSIITDVRAAASALGLQIEVLTAATNRDIDTAFASLAQAQAAGLLVSADTLFYSRRVQLVTLAVKYSVPVIFPYREDARSGGLMSYGPNARSALFAQGGIYTARILKGEKPNDLPIMRVNTFEFVINLQTARTLGVTVPPTLLAIADEVIE